MVCGLPKVDFRVAAVWVDVQESATANQKTKKSKKNFTAVALVIPGADIGEHKKGHFEIQAWIFISFTGFRDILSKVCWVPWTKQSVCCYACFQASFSNVFWV